MAARRNREAVGVFNDFAALRSAADALMSAGFDRAALSLLADPRTVRRKLGRSVEDVRALEDDPTVPFRAYVAGDSRVEGETALIGVAAYIGAMAAGIIAAANGLSIGGIVAWVVAAAAGPALIGAIFAGRLEGGYRAYVRDLVRAGGLVLWVDARDEAHELRALEILRAHGASDVHAHDRPVHGFIDGGAGVSQTLAWLNKPFFRALARR